MNDLAPIVLFVYNRPLHTEQTLEALSKNELANESVLHIFCDGPKEGSSEENLKRTEEVRKIVRRKQWCKEVNIHESTINRGLADSIVFGVTEIVNRYAKAIVLEDDLITSSGFVRYMNDALNVYESEPSVMHISGYMFPVKAKLPATFFYNTASCWGWGTWKRAWKLLETNPEKLYQSLKKKYLLPQFTLNGSADFEKQLLANIDGKMKTWAVKWYATLVLNQGYSLHPYPSLVNNIGHDNSGENCSISKDFGWGRLAKSIEVQKIPLKESRIARKAMIEFYKKRSGSKTGRITKIKNKIKKPFKRLYRKLTSIAGFGRSKEDILLEQLKKKPRFNKGTVTLLGMNITYVDSASFVFIFKEIFKTGIYAFKTNNPEPYIIDCGSNIGLSILYFKRQFPNAQILGFEPDPAVYEVLRNNVHGFTNIQVIMKALWNEKTTLQFYSEGADGGSINDVGTQKSVTTIETVRLRDYLTRPVDFLKVDIEGAEIKVLEDCEERLHFVDKIFIEYHSFLKESQSLSKLLTILERNHFRYHINSPGVSSKQPFVKMNVYNNMDMQLNIYAYRNESTPY